jgi:transcriptional regulator NrdR family protein
MVKQVQKKNNFKEEFQIDKLKRSIEKAAREAGHSDDKVFEIIEELAEYVMNSIYDLETVDTLSLRNLILNKLDEKYPEVAESWRKYEKEVKNI